jgi:hypothetical protein
VITFRYHIVSLVAVFLALALGIVLGTTALNGPVTTDLRHQVNDLKADRTQLAGEAKTLQGQVDSSDEFATTYGAKLVAGALRRQSVLIVCMPGVPTSMENGISAQLTAAGASISGRLVFAPAFTDPAQQSSVDTLVTNGTAPFGLRLPPTSDAGQLGGALLAYVLVGKGQPTDLKTVLGEFAGLHMITSDPQGITSSQTIVVLTSGTLSQNSYAGQTELDLISALGNVNAHTVVAGDADSAASSGLIGLVRTSPTKSTVSTVDDADSPVGQVSTTLAVAGATKGEVGQYGTKKGSQAQFPTPTN